MVGNVTIEGIDELVTKLHNLGADVNKVLPQAGKKGMMLIQAKIQKDAPKEIGNYAASWNTRAEQNGDTWTITTGTNLKAAKSDMPLGIYLEYGTGIYAEAGNGRKTPWAYINASGELIFTHGSRPHPHVRPAVDSLGPKVPSVVAAELQKAIARYAK